MSLIIDYYTTIASPWAYLGHERLCHLAQKYQATINFKPVDFGFVFSKTGGLPLAKRSTQRQQYRFQELERWRDEIGIELNLRPKHFPVVPIKATLMCLKADKEGVDLLPVVYAFMRAIWAEEKDITDDTTLIEIASKLGLDGKTLLGNSNTPELLSLCESYTNEALERGVFGAPSYVIDDENFWGQDRLMFVEKKLKQEAGK